MPYTFGMKNRVIVAGGVALVVAAFAMVSCAGSGSGGGGDAGSAPLSAVTDAKAHSDRRIKAIRRLNEAVAGGETDAASARESLKRVAWSRATWWQIRAAAIEELLEDDANLADTRNMMRLMLPTEPASQIVQLITDRATQGQWRELSAALVRRWAKLDSRVKDSERPERAALVAIFPGQPVEDAVFGVFAGRVEGVEVDERSRQDAWALLRRIDSSGRTRELLASTDGVGGENDELLSTLRRGARELKVVPDTTEELAWLQRLGAADRAEFWSGAAGVIARLGDEQTAGLKVRHAAIVRWCDRNQPSWLSMGREDLIAEVVRRLDDRPRHWRKETGPGSGKGESMTRWKDSLAWGDVLTVLVADEMMKSPAVGAALFEQAEADKKDTSTEHGGNIDADGGAFRVDFFPPRATQRYGDRRFVPPEEMIRAGDTALFHYHLHATTWDNAEYAGPSQGDLESAAALGRSCLVFTAIDAKRLGVDYYLGNGAVIDLGEIAKR